MNNYLLYQNTELILNTEQTFKREIGEEEELQENVLRYCLRLSIILLFYIYGCFAWDLCIQKRVKGLLELELQMTVSYLVGAGN